MSKRKNHHYIPRFYFKRFSVNNKGKVIGLYNCANSIYVQNAPIKHQACEEFLYGDDNEIESLLADLENNIAKMFHYWTEKKILIPPPQNTNGFIAFKRFILYQLFRTPKAGNTTIEHLNKAFHSFLPLFKPEKIKEFEELEISHENSVLLALLNSADKEYLLNFLDCKFIVNLSELPYITSDSPVILYNQFMEKSDMYIGATGLPAKGLQIFYPIHPRLMICLYDHSVYSCGETINCTSTEKIEDIHQLNTLQYLNCDKQLFFDDSISEGYIVDNLIKGYKDKKKSSRFINKNLKTEDGRSLLFISFEDVHIDLDLSFFKICCNISNFNNGIAPLRHPSLVRKKKVEEPG